MGGGKVSSQIRHQPVVFRLLVVFGPLEEVGGRELLGVPPAGASSSIRRVAARQWCRPWRSHISQMITALRAGSKEAMQNKLDRSGILWAGYQEVILVTVEVAAFDGQGGQFLVRDGSSGGVFVLVEVSAKG